MAQKKKDFSWPVTGISQDNYEAFCAWFEKYEKKIRECHLIIWGAGARGSIFASILRTKHFFDFLFVDSNPRIWGGCVGDADVISPEELKEHQGEMILVSPENSIEIEKYLDENGYKREKDYFVIETKTYEDYLEEFTRAYRQENLILGSCEFMAISIHDKDHKNLEDMLFQRLGKDDTKILALNGIGLRAQYHILRAQIAMGMKPKRLILQINLDTLVAKDHLFPHTQHVELLKMILNTQEHPSVEFLKYLEVATVRSKTPLMPHFEHHGQEGYLSKVKIRNYFQHYYMAELDDDTEGLIYLAKISDCAAATGIEVLTFALPVNYQLARQLFEDKFDVRYESNLEKVKRVTEKKNVRFLDLSYTLGSELFSWPEAPNASLNSQGRRRIAELLCQAIEVMK